MSEDTQDDKSLEIKQDSDGESASNIVSLTTAMSNQQLKSAVKKMSNQRQIIADFVKNSLTEGVDFGIIEATSKSGKSFKSKATLFKPGQEKIFSLFGLVSELEKDTETLDMLNVENLVAYKCNVYKNGIKIAEGRGACVIGDLGRDANATIKIAEKRARMDACLSLGFSEYFTQDLDDPEYRNKTNQTETMHQLETITIEKPSESWSNAQRAMIFNVLRNGGIADSDKQKQVLKNNGYDVNSITKTQASELINKLLAKTLDLNTESESEDDADQSA